jgi:hypothetical protein
MDGWQDCSECSWRYKSSMESCLRCGCPNPALLANKDNTMRWIKVAGIAAIFAASLFILVESNLRPHGYSFAKPSAFPAENVVARENNPGVVEGDANIALAGNSGP